MITALDIQLVNAQLKQNKTKQIPNTINNTINTMKNRKAGDVIGMCSDAYFMHRIYRESQHIYPTHMPSQRNWQSVKVSTKSLLHCCG